MAALIPGGEKLTFFLSQVVMPFFFSRLIFLLDRVTHDRLSERVISA